MILDDKIKYFKRNLDDDGNFTLSDEMNFDELFDMEMLEYLNNAKFYFILKSEHWIKLLKNGANNQQYMNNVVEMICKNWSFKMQQDKFDELMSDNNVAESFIKALGVLISNDNYMLKSIVSRTIVNNDNLLNYILNGSLINADKKFFSNIISSASKGQALKILQNEKICALLFNGKLSEFLRIIRDKDLWDELSSLIDEKIAASSYAEKLAVINNSSFYNPNTGEPKCLQGLYFEFEDKIKSMEIRFKIMDMSTEESKEAARELISTEEGRDIFLREVVEPKFSEIVTALNLDSSFYQMRKDALMNELYNYHKYDLDTIKKLLCYSCFNDNPKNIKYKIMTLMEYAAENKKASMLLKDNIEYLTKLYKFLECDTLDINPLDLVSSIDINGLIREAHRLFADEVKDKTNVMDILKSNGYTEKHGVRVFDVDIPLERAYFMTHIVTEYAFGSSPVEAYQQAARTHNKLCMSMLDNNHVSTFLRGNGVNFGYCNLEAPVYTAMPYDAQSNQRSVTAAERPQYRSLLSGTDKFMKRTADTSYNEITYFTNNQVIMPNYILVTNREPNELEYRIAKAFNIPILVYHTKDIEWKKDSDYVEMEAFDYETLVLDYIPREESRQVVFDK